MTQVVSEPAYSDIMRSLMLCSEGGMELYLRNPASFNIPTGSSSEPRDDASCRPWGGGERAEGREAWMACGKAAHSPACALVHISKGCQGVSVQCTCVGLECLCLG